MSHFTVLVVGENPEEQLAPYHEFECTGEVDQYVQTIDRTDEVRREYAESMEAMLRGPNGELVSRYDDRFYREMTPEEKKEKPFSNGKVAFIPEGWEETEVPTKSVKSLLKFAEDYYGWTPVPFGQKPDLNDTHKFGWMEVDANGEVLKCFDRTNPNKKWDWYVLGGRWTGFFKAKSGVAAKIGRPGLMTEPAKVGYADQLRKKDIDIEGMRKEAEAEAATLYDRVHAIIAGRDWMTWDDIQRSYAPDHNKARNIYQAQEVVKDINKEKDFFFLQLEPFKLPRDTYLERARTKCLQTFAVVKDSKWYERGSMGWWGSVSDEKSELEWTRQFHALLDSLSDDTLLSVYDCHI